MILTRGIPRGRPGNLSLPTGYCRGCGLAVPKGRFTWCGDECIQRFLVRNQPAHARRLVFERDQGRCARCGDVSAEWEADHVIPVCEGGGGCGLENLRTLCRACHVIVTAELSARRAYLKKRRAAWAAITGMLPGRPGPESPWEDLELGRVVLAGLDV